MNVSIINVAKKVLIDGSIRYIVSFEYPRTSSIFVVNTYSSVFPTVEVDELDARKIANAIKKHPDYIRDKELFDLNNALREIMHE